jgi:hypothetical protein
MILENPSKHLNNFFLYLPDFFDFFENGLTDKVGRCLPNVFLPSSYKKLSKNGAPSEKLCLFYERYLNL